MGMCEKLIWNRKRLGLTQKEYADKLGLNVGTIVKLEKDETAWQSIRQRTEDAIRESFQPMSSWQPENAGKVIREIAEQRAIDRGEIEVEVEPEPITVVQKSSNGLNELDQKTLTLMEFAYEGLTSAKTHEDFVANTTLLSFG